MSALAGRPAAGRYFPALTGFRVVAASLVFLAHHAYVLPEASPQLLRELVLTTYVSVSMFFVLSGYVIAQQYFNNALTLSAYWRFLALRLVRVFPVYWLLLYGLYVRWLFSIPELLLHATLLKGYFIRYQLAGIVQAWTLTVELTFYLLAPLLFYLVKSRSLVQTWVLCLVLGVLGALGAWVVADNPARNLAAVLHNMTWMTFFGRATEFFAGIGLYRLLSARQYQAPRQAPWLPYTYLGWLLVLAVCLVLALMARPGQPAVDTWPGLLVHHLLLPGSIAMILYGLMVERTWLQRVLSWPFVVVLGHATYIFYLIHIGWVRNWLVNQVTTSVPLLFLCCWLLSLAGHYLFERPVYQWCKSKIRKA